MGVMTQNCCRTDNTKNCCGGDIFSPGREKDIRIHPKMFKEPKKLKSFIMRAKQRSETGNREGFLQVLIPGYIYSEWHTVYGILADRKLKYYEQKGDDQILACLNFDHFMHSLRADANDGTIFAIEIVNSE